MTYFILFMAGIENALSPQGLLLLGITVSLCLLGWFSKKKIFTFMAFLFVLGFSIVYLTIPLPFFGYEDSLDFLRPVNGSFFEKLTFNLGFALVPLLISAAAFLGFEIKRRKIDLN